MATSPSLLDPILRWLRHVDEQISPGQSIEFLKLPLYPFLRVEYAVAEGLKTPSEIHNFLLKKCFENDKEKTLYWFAHGLSLLGGDLRGTYLVGDNCLQEYGLSLPAAPDQSQMTEELQFFECLTRIATKARGLDLEEGLKYRFSKRRFLNVNPRHLKHLPDLFIRLVQDDIIAPKKTYHLRRALLKLGSTRAVQCLICLNKYHKSIGLDEIEEVRDIEEDPQTEAYITTDQSSDTGHGAAYARSRLLISGRYGYRRFRDRQDHRSRDFDESLRTLGQLSPIESEGTSMSTSDSEFSSQAVDTSTSSVPASTTGPDSHTCTHCCKSILCSCWVLALVITLALAGSLCGTVWRHVFHTQVSDVHNKSPVNITVNQYYDRQLQLYSKVTNRSVIEIYRFNTSCDHLQNISHTVPDDPQYSLQICNISDNNTNKDGDHECTVNLEFKIGKVCIVVYEGGISYYKVTKHVLKVLLTSALPIALVLLALFTGLVVYIIYTAVKICCRKRNNQYVPVNVQA